MIVDVYICKKLTKRGNIMKKKGLAQTPDQIFDDYETDQEIITDEFEEDNKSPMVEINDDFHDSVKSYLKDVSHYKLLTLDEEKELSKRIQEGDEQALQELIQSNLRLVIKIAKVYVTNDYPLIDIIQDGNVGLIRAAEKFDYRKNVKFSTYAAPWIKQMIIRALSQKRRMVRIPFRKESNLRKIKDVTSKFHAEHHRYPTNSELSKELGIKSEEVKNTRHSDHSVSSLDSAINEEKTLFLDSIDESNDFSPDVKLINNDMKNQTMKALNSLYPQERLILVHRFGIDSEEKYTLKEMGLHFGISAETVRQIESRTLKKLEESHHYLKSYIYS